MKPMNLFGNRHKGEAPSRLRCKLQLCRNAHMFYPGVEFSCEKSHQHPETKEWIYWVDGAVYIEQEDLDAYFDVIEWGPDPTLNK